MSARKPGRDADAAREAILSAAETVFAKAGFAGARIDSIATESGYNKSLIFHYFGDKLELYRAVVARRKGEMLGQLAHVMAPVEAANAAPHAAPTRAAVEAVTEAAVRWLFDYYRTHPHMLRVLAWEAAEGWETFTRFEMGRRNGDWVAPLSDFLHRARAAGVLRATLDPVMLIANILGMTQIYLASIPHYRELFPDAALDTDAALDAAREQIVGLILHGALAVAEGNTHPALS